MVPSFPVVAVSLKKKAPDSTVEKAQPPSSPPPSAAAYTLDPFEYTTTGWPDAEMVTATRYGCDGPDPRGIVSSTSVFHAPATIVFTVSSWPRAVVSMKVTHGGSPEWAGTFQARAHRLQERDRERGSCALRVPQAAIGGPGHVESPRRIDGQGRPIHVLGGHRLDLAHGCRAERHADIGDGGLHGHRPPGPDAVLRAGPGGRWRSEEHTSELQS